MPSQPALRGGMALPTKRERGGSPGRCPIVLLVVVSGWAVGFMALSRSSPSSLMPRGTTTLARDATAVAPPRLTTKKDVPSPAASLPKPVSFAELFEGHGEVAKEDSAASAASAASSSATTTGARVGEAAGSCLASPLVLDDGFGVVAMRDVPFAARPHDELPDVGVVPRTPCEAKAECRRRGPRSCAAFLWSTATGTAVVLGPAELAAAVDAGAPARKGTAFLYVALYRRADPLEAMLATWRRRGLFQTRSSAAILGRAARWPAKGGAPMRFNGTVSHGLLFITEGGSSGTHRAVDYAHYAISHEVWVDPSSQKLEEVYDGLCAAKTRCASMASCDGFVFRARDGTALLYARLQLRHAGDPSTQRSLDRFAAKFRRVTYLFLRQRGNAAATVAGVCVSAREGVALGPREEEEEEEKDDDDHLPPHVERERLAADQSRLEDLRADDRWPPDEPLKKKKKKKKKNGTTLINQEPRVVISLTTLPGRIDQIRPVLESLVRQTVVADEIVVVVPRKESRLGGATAVPAWLAAFPHARVLRPEKDYGPATKLIPALQELFARAAACEKRGDGAGARRELETRLVVVDDDTLYPQRLVESLVRWAEALPRAAVATTGWPVARNLRYPHWTQNYLVYGNELYAPHRVAIVRGNCGFLLRPRFLDEAVWREMDAAPRGAVLMDDVWISGHLARRGIPRVVVPLDPEQTTKTPEFKDVVTLDSQLGSGITDRPTANEQAIRHFKTAWDVFWTPPRPEVEIVGGDPGGAYNQPPPS